jgi:hypothetical protein
MIDLMLDRIRKLTDHCARMQSFLVFYSFGGGTAAGFGCLLLERLLTDSSKKSKLNFSVYSARQVSTTPVELSNRTFATSGTINHSESAITVDHWAPYNVPVSLLTSNADRYEPEPSHLAGGLKIGGHFGRAFAFVLPRSVSATLLSIFNVILLAVCTALCLSF